MSEKFNQDNRPIPELRYCTRCCFPETVEGIKFDEMGICRSCLTSEQKIHIDWKEKEKALGEILNRAKEKSGDKYDCFIPNSGGKDSTFQLYVLTKVYKMKPLAVTFNHNWMSKTGFYNLMNCLEQFNVDHIMYTPNRKLISQSARKSIEEIGDACWHCHAGIGAFPLHIAQKFKIPLLIWGESIADSSGKASYEDPKIKFDRNYFTKVSAKVTPKQMTCNSSLKMKDLHMFEPPTTDELKEVGVWGIHLGDYIFWDDERQTEFVKKHFGWREVEMEGTYKRYKGVECIMQGVHDFMCYLKRGYARTTWQASLDVRNGLMTRQEAFELIKKHDKEIPEALDYFLEVANLNDVEFYDLINKMKVEGVKGIDLPKSNRKSSLEETKRKPFVQQLIDELRPSPNDNINK